MVRVGTDAEVETFLAGRLDEVLVGANTGGLEGLRAQLLELIGDEMNAEREVVDGSALAAEVEDADLGVRHTTVKPRLGVRLEEKEAMSANHHRKFHDARAPILEKIPPLSLLI